MQFFTRVTEDDLKVTFDRLSRSGKVLARKFPYVFAYSVDHCLKEVEPESAAKFQPTQVKWVEGYLKVAKLNKVPSDAVFPSFLGVNKTCGLDVAEEYESTLLQLTGFLGGIQPTPEVPVPGKGRPFLQLVVNNT